MLLRISKFSLLPIVILGLLVAILVYQHAAQSTPVPPAAANLTAREAWDLALAVRMPIVDIRRQEEWYQTGTPQGAMRLSFETHPEGPEGFLRDLSTALGGDKTRPFAIICRTGNRTNLLLPFLHANGFIAAQAIPEGMVGSSHGRGWLGNDLPVDR